MKRSLLSTLAAAALLAGATVASAETSTTATTTTRWSPDHRAAITEYSTTQKYQSFNDPAFKPHVGAPLPGTVTLYPLPGTIKVETPDRYSYSIINNNPVIVDRTTRSVVHTWD